MLWSMQYSKGRKYQPIKESTQGMSISNSKVWMIGKIRQSKVINSFMKRDLLFKGKLFLSANIKKLQITTETTKKEQITRGINENFPYLKTSIFFFQF